MSTETKKEIQLEMAHVLFIDAVGYSKLSLDDQRDAHSTPLRAGSALPLRACLLVFIGSMEQGKM